MSKDYCHLNPQLHDGFCGAVTAQGYECSRTAKWHLEEGSTCMHLCSQHANKWRQGGAYVTPLAGIQISDFEKGNVYGGFTSEQYTQWFGCLIFAIIPLALAILGR